MNPQLEKIREVQRDSWNKSSSGWRKWDTMMMSFLSSVTECMLGMVRLQPDNTVLDVATGTGEPGLSIAGFLPAGNVVATDLSEEMLGLARENAEAKKLSNYETVNCDAALMPFADDKFDAVFCRHGFMFFGDMAIALEEMMRVLKPGGILVASVWNVSERNPWICNSMQTMISLLNLNPPAPGGPGLFRCTEPGMMRDLFENGGLKMVDEQIVPAFLPCESFDQYWEFISEVASPTAFKSATAEIKEIIRQTLYNKVMSNQQDGMLMLEASSIVISGVKI